MAPDLSQYGLWPVAILNAAIFILFAFSFFKPSRRNRRPPYIPSRICLSLSQSFAYRIVEHRERVV